jgi:hypothetical protein
VHRGLSLIDQWLRPRAGDQYQVHRIGQIMEWSVDLLVNHLDRWRGGFVVAAAPYLGRHTGL